MQQQLKGLFKAHFNDTAFKLSFNDPMTIDLHKPSSLPVHFQERLLLIKPICLQYDYSDELFSHPLVNLLVQDTNKYCLNHRVVGIHYTRSDRESIITYGLLIRSGSEIRETFLADHAELFTEQELASIKNSWKAYFTPEQVRARDKRICINYTDKALLDSGAEPLLSHYGGEQVYMGFDRDDPIRQKLKTIGQPLIVRCSLDTAKLINYDDNSFGKVLVSSYHCSINPDALQFDQDASIYEPVYPGDIINAIIISP